MSYRDEAIRRMKDDRSWDEFTTETRQWVEGLTDEQAKKVLADADEADCDFKAALKPLEIYHRGLRNLREVFGGAILSSTKPNRLCLALAELAHAAEEFGFPPQKAARQVQQITQEGWTVILVEAGKSAK
jgi:hypothetical protein